MIDLRNGDCIDILQNVKDESIDLIVTDPPYRLVAGGCTNNAVTIKKSCNMKDGRVFKNNNINFSDWIPICFAKLKQRTHCYIMCNDRNLYNLLNECQKVGFQLLNILVWKKTAHSPNRYYLKNCEFIVMLRKGEAKNINNMGTYSVLEVTNVKDKLHPSEKPVELMKILIANSSNENDVVLDPFMGVGSSGVACKELNRNFIGIEIDAEYFGIAKKRIEDNQIKIKKKLKVKSFL
jgi:site-specific DNA-methyltransferase (adenine-specific)